MITVLTNLKEVIETYGIPHLNQEEDKQIEQALLSELAEIANNSHPRYFSHGNLEMAQESFRKFYTSLRELFNMLYQKKGEQPDAVILQFHKLIKTFETLYIRDMELNDPLTDYQFQLLKADVLEKFPPLKDAILKKGIWENLLLEIQSAINGHFDSSSELLYHHFLFYNKLIKVLTKIAHDTRAKDWERRFIETMININFNHMGFYNRLSEIINYQLNTLCEQHQLMSIIINGLGISQATRDPQIYYDRNRAHLADLLIEYTEKKKILNAMQKIETKSDDILDKIESCGILSNLSRTEIIVLFHYIYKAGFLKGKSKLEAAESFSNFVFTSNNIKIPVAQLVKIDRNKYQSSIKTVRKKFLEAVALMDEDLKDLGRSNQLEL